MLDYKKIEDLIIESDNVVITAHKNLDLDALGAVLSMYFVCKKYNKKSTLMIDDVEFESGVDIALNKISSLDYNVEIKTYEELMESINSNTLLILVDTNKKEMVQNKNIFDIVNNIIVIDHHIKEEDYNINTKYEYINSDNSSMGEILVDLIKELDIYIPEYVATIILAGIIIDTNNFYLKTTKKTHYAASVLKELNADSKEMQYLLKQDFNNYIERQKIILKARFLKDNIAISNGELDKIYEKEDLAKTADTLLLFKNVEAAFVIGNIENNEIGISARSLGKIDVQEIMEKMGGGGHITDAATQLKNKTIEEVEETLISLL